MTCRTRQSCTMSTTWSFWNRRLRSSKSVSWVGVVLLSPACCQHTAA
jgi:hypothetical protein